MKIVLSLVLMLAGWVLYFALTFSGIYRLYPLESYILLALAIWLAYRVARRKGGWWRYTICGFICFISALFVYWTVVFSQLPDQQLSVSVGEEFIPITLTDHDGNRFHSPDLVGKGAALYLFYRGDW
jgi:hypothetical protein